MPSFPNPIHHVYERVNIAEARLFACDWLCRGEKMLRSSASLDALHIVLRCAKYVDHVDLLHIALRCAPIVRGYSPVSKTCDGTERVSLVPKNARVLTKVLSADLFRSYNGRVCVIVPITYEMPFDGVLSYLLRNA